MKIPRVWCKRRSVLAAAAIALVIICSGSVLWAAGGGGHDAPPKGWVATDTYRVINFAVLFGALFFLLRKPVAQALSSRIKGIEEQLSELEGKKRVAEQELAAYDEKLAQLDQEAEKIVAQYIQQGEEARERILKEAEAAAEKLEVQGKRAVEHEFKLAREALQAEIVEKALGKAEELLQGKITAEDQERLVEEYLEKVVA